VGGRGQRGVLGVGPFGEAAGGGVKRRPQRRPVIGPGDGLGEPVRVGGEVR
jgi:hypothetical protein